ncbi:MAG: hypothetical protein ACE15B_12765 [Bryobacteraceae bacterium]
MGRQFTELVRHFFQRFFDNEIVSPAGDIRVTVGNILALLATPGAILPVFLLMKYSDILRVRPELRDVFTYPEKLLFITWSFVVMGVVTVLEWDTLFPDRHDYAVLTPLPIRFRTVLAAKVTALGALLAIFSVDLNVVSTLIYPFLAAPSMRNAKGLADVAHYAGAHAAAVFGAAAFVFLLLIGVQGLTMNALPRRWFRRVSRWTQVLCLVALALAFLSFPRMGDMLHPWKPASEAWLRFFPPAWFVGLYEVLVGSTRPQMFLMARWAVWGLCGAAAAAGILYLAAYARHYRRSLEAAVEEAGNPSLVQRAFERAVNALVVRRPLEQAVFHFAAQTLARSRKHRLYFSAYAGVGAALVINGLAAIFARRGYGAAAEPRADFLAVPLVLAFFTLSGMRVVYAVPAEVAANWIFRVSEPARCAECLEGARKFLLLCGAGPVLLLTLPPCWVLWGWRTGLVHTVFCATMAALLAELLLLKFAKIPFTCAYAPGKSNMTGTWVGYCVAFSTYAYTMTAIEASLLKHPEAFAVFYTILAGAAFALRVIRKALLDGMAPAFDDRADPAVMVLNLSGHATLE